MNFYNNGLTLKELMPFGAQTVCYILLHKNLSMIS